jgi:hypothetical protein
MSARAGINARGAGRAPGVFFALWVATYIAARVALRPRSWLGARGDCPVPLP